MSVQTTHLARCDSCGATQHFKPQVIGSTTRFTDLPGGWAELSITSTESQWPKRKDICDKCLKRLG